MYRNDKTAVARPEPARVPHRSAIAGRGRGQEQAVEFLASGGTRSSTRGGPFEVPIRSADELLGLHFTP